MAKAKEKVKPVVKTVGHNRDSNSHEAWVAYETTE